MKLYKIKDIEILAKKISKLVESGDTIFLFGELGVGKTTFVRFLINKLETKTGIKKSDVLSPSFNIVYDYNLENIKILHYDLYRLKNHNDIIQLGIFDTFDNYIKIIEWPELIKSKPKNRIDIFMKYSKSMNCRKIKIKGFGKWKKYNFDEI